MLVEALFFCYYSDKEWGGVMYGINITEYIKNNSRLSRLDFMTVYQTIKELIKDGKVKEDVSKI